MSDDVKREAKVSQNLITLAKEITLLTYTVKQLIDAVNGLKAEVGKAKVIQVPYPVYQQPQIQQPPINPIPTKPYIGDPITPPFIFNKGPNG